MPISISNFNSFLSIPDEGLKGELTAAEVNSYGTQRILRMKHFIPDQPNFFISRESWELLFAGKTISGGVEKIWIPTDSEVYGFVFCIATHKNKVIQAIPPERAYFRVRTIIKKISTIDSTDPIGIPVLVETDNIAFVNLSKALRNNRISTPSPLENCLEFIAKGDGLSLKNEIDLEVKDWKEKQRNSTSVIKFIDTVNGEKIIPIVQEGAIFSKKRIKEILTKYTKATGTTIDIALDTKNPAFSFYFDINPGFTTLGMPCPPPETACHYPDVQL